MKDPLDALARGRVVAAATESFFGLLADATSTEAVESLFRVKPRSQGVALIIPDARCWGTLVDDIPPPMRRLADAFWPGPLTIALRARPTIDTRLTVGGTVGVRVPGASVAADLVGAFGRPLTATSANPSGLPPVTDGASVQRYFPEAIARRDLLVAEGICPGGAPSTLVGMQHGKIILLRAGAIELSDITAAAGPGL